MKLMKFETAPPHVSCLLPSFQYLLLPKWPKNDEAQAPPVFRVYLYKGHYHVSHCEVTPF